MSKELEQALLKKVKELTKLRYFHYEYIFVDSCQIIGKGQGGVTVNRFGCVNQMLLQEIKDSVVEDVKRKGDCPLEFSTENVVLTLIVELEDKDSPKDNNEEEYDSSIAELDRKITEIASVKIEEQGFLSTERLFNIYISKIFDIFKKLMQNPNSSEQQMLNSELLSSLYFLPDEVQQALLDFYNKM